MIPRTESTSAPSGIHRPPTSERLRVTRRRLLLGGATGAGLGGLVELAAHARLTLAAGAAAGLAQEAGGPPQRGPETITLVWATPGDQTEFDLFVQVAEQFTRLHPHIRVANDAPSSSLDVMTRQAAAGTLPDVIFRTVTEFPFFASQGVWLPLDDLIARDGFDLPDFFPQIVAPYQYDGQRFGTGPLHALPRDIHERSMFYNADHFAEAGIRIPSTTPSSRTAWSWDDFRSAAVRLSPLNSGRYGYSMETWWGMWAIWAWGAGGELVDDPWAPTRATMNTPQVVEALQFWTNLILRDRVAPPLSEYAIVSRSNHFAQGRASMYNNGRWNVPNFRRSQFKWDVMLMPVWKTRAQLLTGNAFGLASTSSFVDEAWELLKLISSADTQQAFTETGLLFPSRMSVAGSDTFLLSTPPQSNDVYLKEVEYARILPMHPRYPEMQRAVDRSVQDNLLTGRMTVRDVAIDITLQVDRILQDS